MDEGSAGGGADKSARWTLGLFGRFKLSTVASGEVTLGGRRERLLLAYLALSTNGRASRRKLTALLWGADSDETTLDNLRVCVWRLRKAFGDAKHRIIASEGDDIALDLEAVEVDVLTFRRLAASSSTSELEAAAKLYGGEFLEELDIESEEFESWRREEATRCKNQVLDLLGVLMTRLAESGEIGRAIDAGLRILRLEPLHEAGARRLMQLYAESGRRGAATELYRSLVDSLKSELNAPPEAETRALFSEIARGSEEPIRPALADGGLSLDATTIISAIDASGQSGKTGRFNNQPNNLLRSLLRSRAIMAASLAACVIVAAALFFYPAREGLSGAQPGSGESSVSASPTSAISIAVLPFTNISGDASQDFFSQGMTEEITAALAKIPDLRVVARSSAFQFKGERDIRTVGEALGASHLIEGSVRKDGQRVRITAQLKADDGTHLWTETYNRELRDVFAIQEEIAEAIGGALRTRLGLRTGERLVSNRDIDPDSYQQFLRARPLMRARIDGVHEAARILEAVVARNPDYAPAVALLAVSHAFIDSEAAWNESLPKAEAEARRAVQLDPNLADAYWALARVLRLRGKLVEADDLFVKALMLDPSNPDVLDLYMLHLSNVGRVKEALVIAQKLRALEPYVPAFNADVGQIFWINGQTDAAIDILRPLIGFGAVRGTLAMIFASDRRFDESADLLDADAATSVLPEGSRAERRQAADLLRAVAKSPDATRSLPRIASSTLLSRTIHLDFVYLHGDAPDRALETYEDTIRAGQVGGQGGTFAYLWHPSYAPVRKTERFKLFVRDAGMLEYWRAKGWPEFCRPVAGDDFDCN